MYRRFRLAIPILLILLADPWRALNAQGPAYHRGHTMSPDEVKAWDFTVGPQGKELPPGNSTAREGAKVWAVHCAACHGIDGKYQWPQRVHLPSGGKAPMLAGDANQPVSTSIWDYVKGKSVIANRQFATTVWDYINRAMPLGEKAGTLNASEVYGVTAYVLYLNGIIGQDDVLDAKSLPKVHMPHGPAAK
jgi:S-disulfanyl-L-cysteine oxidoreductase SoxD